VTSPDAPQISALRRRAAALEEQIRQERNRISNSSDGLAERIATYDRLNLDREFANRMLTLSETELSRARGEALRQQLYLERVVQAQLADYPSQPRRVANILTMLASNAILVLIIWILFSGIIEHGAQFRR
jgi:capsular polysaccharide transport system permease protein